MRRGADIESDHHLVATKIKMRLSTRKNLLKPTKKFNVGKLKQKNTGQMFQIFFSQPLRNASQTKQKQLSRDDQHSKKQLLEQVKMSWDEHISEGNRGSVTNYGRKWKKEEWPNKR